MSSPGSGSITNYSLGSFSLPVFPGQCSAVLLPAENSGSCMRCLGKIVVLLSANFHCCLVCFHIKCSRIYIFLMFISLSLRASRFRMWKLQGRPSCRYFPRPSGSNLRLKSWILLWPGQGQPSDQRQEMLLLSSWRGPDARCVVNSGERKKRQKFVERDSLGPLTSLSLTLGSK